MSTRSRLFSALIATSALLLLGACGDSSPGTPDSGADQGDGPTTNPTPDSSVDGPTVDAEPDQPKQAAYPAGPYGTSEGSVIANIEWQGYADKDFHCHAKTSAHKMDLTTPQRISLADFYSPPNCPDKKKRVLWIIVSAGWCGPCWKEVQSTQDAWEKDQIDPRVAIVNAVYQTDKRAPAELPFAKLWAKNNNFSLSFPVAADPDAKVRTYFVKPAIPFNMLIDLDTMKIFFRQSGENLPAVGKAISNHLKANP